MNNNKKILITEFINQNSFEHLNKKFDVRYDEKLFENENEITRIIKDYDGLIVRNKTQVNLSILKNALKLKFIGRLGVGLDNIDTGYCKSKNIHVQPATGMNADSVAEYVVSSSMSLIKKIPMFHNGTIKGEWPRTTIKSIEINQKYLGIIGFGTIGKKVAEYSSKNGLKILVYDPYVKEINNKSGDVTISENESLFEKSLIADQVNWANGFTPENNLKVKAKIRYNAIEKEAILNLIDEDQISITFYDPVRAITPGQPVVLYKEDSVLGGGIIKETVSIKEKSNV